MITSRQQNYFIADKVKFLSEPSNYPDKPTEIEVIQTHFSWVFLTNDFAYKLKKPIQQELFDLRTLESRKANCLEELRLNQRSAPDVYIDVIPLSLNSAGGLEINGKGKPIDWLIKMNKLPNEDMLDTSIQHNSVTDNEVIETISRLIQFYKSLPEEIIDPGKLLSFKMKRIHDNRKYMIDLNFGMAKKVINSNSDALLQFMDKHRSWLQDRIENGFIRELHGDLRPEHICIRPDPIFIDCLEFSKALRIADMADEVSYLSMECDRLDRGDIAKLIIDTYKELAPDDIEPVYVHFFKAYRAMIRSKIAIYHLLEDQYANDHDKYLEQANDYLNQATINIAQLKSLWKTQRKD